MQQNLPYHAKAMSVPSKKGIGYSKSKLHLNSKNQNQLKPLFKIQINSTRSTKDSPSTAPEPTTHSKSLLQCQNLRSAQKVISAIQKDSSDK